MYKCFFVLFFFIILSINLPVDFSMFEFIPTSEKGQETPTSWPLLPCPEEFEEVEWIVGKMDGWKMIGKVIRKMKGKEKKKIEGKAKGEKRIGFLSVFLFDF